jgi:hypothetical protein
LSLPFTAGRLALGSWQGVYLASIVIKAVLVESSSPCTVMGHKPLVLPADNDFFPAAFDSR